jgi:hypothetical protein
MSHNSDNIFKQTSRWWQQQTSRERKMLDVAVIDNPDQIFDNLILPVKIALAIIVGITLAGGAWYHFAIFKAVFQNNIVGMVGSVAWFILIETCKVYLGWRLVLLVYSGGAFQSWPKFFVTTLLTVIVSYAFYLSIGISSRNIGAVSNSQRTTQLLEAKPFTAPASIATLDNQIAEAEKAIAAGKKSTWKGKPTTEGLRLMEKNSDLKARLVEQRSKELAAAQSEHATLIAAQTGVIAQGSRQINIYGGILEALTALLLLTLGLFVKISADQNKALAETTETTSSHKDLTQSGKPETSHLKHQFSDNAAERRPIGFRMQESPVSAPPLPETKQPKTVVTTAFQPVSAPETKVLKQTIIRDDIEREVAEQVRNIQRYFTKWENRGKGGGRPETILANLASFFKTIAQLQQEGDISTALKTKVMELHLKYQTITPNKTTQP